MTGKHKTRLVGWHPSGPALVGWLDAEIERRGGGRGAQSAILDEALEKAMNDTGTTRTEFDLRAIAQARALADAWTTDSLRTVTGRDAETDVGLVHSEALGIALKVIGDLLAIIDRGGGHAAAQTTEDRPGDDGGKRWLTATTRMTGGSRAGAAGSAR